MIYQRKVVAVALALFVFGVLSACGGSRGESGGGTEAAATASKGTEDAAKDQSGSGGTLIVGMTAGNIPDPNTPPNEGFEGRRWVGFQLYDGLANWDLAQGETVPQPKPALAEKWSVGEDKVTWTFNLRRGVKFHDGTDFNAEAVIFQLNRISNREFEFFDAELFARNRTETQDIAGFRAMDPYTVEIKTTSPFAFLPVSMAQILYPSPAAIRKLGTRENAEKNYSKNPVGTGPFKVDKFVEGQALEMVPNQEYWGTKAKLDRIILKPMADPATRLAALQSGQINMTDVLPPDSKKLLESGGYNIILKQYPHAIMFWFNLYDKPFDNPKVREAMQYAADRDGLCKSLLGGLCMASSQMMYKGHPWYNEAQGDTYKYDPAKAKAMLAEAGYANGFKITIPYTTGGSGNMWPTPMMEKLQQDFKAVGVEVTLEPMEWNTLITLGRRGFAEAEVRQKYQMIWSSPATNSAISLLRFTQSRIPPNGNANVGAYRSEEVDRLLYAAQAEFDQTKQDALIGQAMGVVARDNAVMFWVHDLNFRVMSPKVRGFVQSQSWFADLTTVWVKP